MRAPAEGSRGQRGVGPLAGRSPGAGLGCGRPRRVQFWREPGGEGGGGAP